MKPTKIKFLSEFLGTTCFFTMLLVVAILAPRFGSSQESHRESWNAYYPLAKGNSWKYTVVIDTADKSQQFVVWKVLNISANSKGTVFAIWPTPVQSDDEGMQLQFTHDGLKELSNDFYLLKFPLLKGFNWNAEGHQRVFTVVSEGEPCTVGKKKFTKCAVIQDDDHEAKLRTLTTYAFGVGPVRYEYWRLKGDEAQTPATQTMEIVSYSVKQSPLLKAEQPHDPAARTKN